MRGDFLDGLALSLLVIVVALAADLDAGVSDEPAFLHAAAALGAGHRPFLFLPNLRLGAVIAEVPAGIFHASMADDIFPADDAELLGEIGCVAARCRRWRGDRHRV